MNETSLSMESTPQAGGPAMTRGLTYLVMLVALTHMAALLMNQPAAYWLDPRRAQAYPFGFLLRAGPIVYLLLVAIYMVGLRWLLRRLSPATLLAVSAGLLLVHLVGLAKATVCGFYPIFEVRSVVSCYTFRYAPLGLGLVLIVLVLAGLRLPARWLESVQRPLSGLAVAWVLLMVYGVVRAAAQPDSPWQPLTPAHNPGPRSMAAVAYDTQRQRAVLFGGLTSWNGREWVYDTSTWEWDGQDWHKIESKVTPAGRTLHAMAYDEKLGRVILYGGQNSSGVLADLWAWDGVNWHRLCPVCNPAARFRHEMIYDPERERIVLYGGQDAKLGLAEGWTWDGQAWTYFQFSESSPALYDAPMVYDEAGKRIVSFMGRMWGGTWIWQGDQWHKSDWVIQPPGRDEAVLVYDPEQQVSILFGGTNEDKLLYDDTWMLRGDTWTQLETPLAPPQRSKAVAFYDPVRKSIILYGGERYGFIYNDMWELKYSPGGQE